MRRLQVCNAQIGHSEEQQEDRNAETHRVADVRLGNTLSLYATASAAVESNWSAVGFVLHWRMLVLCAHGLREWLR